MLTTGTGDLIDMLTTTDLWIGTHLAPQPQPPYNHILRDFYSTVVNVADVIGVYVVEYTTKNINKHIFCQPWPIPRVSLELQHTLQEPLQSGVLQYTVGQRIGTYYSACHPVTLQIINMCCVMKKYVNVNVMVAINLETITRTKN